MIFWESAEVDKEAYPALVKVCRCVELFLNAAFAETSLATLQCELRYIPIIMPEGMRERYPARSELRKKEQLYDCAPQLNFEIFVSGTFEDQLREYLRGIAESAPYLAKLGATPEQTDDFNKIMATAVARILIERPDQTRH